MPRANGLALAIDLDLLDVKHEDDGPSNRTSLLQKLRLLARALWSNACLNRQQLKTNLGKHPALDFFRRCDGDLASLFDSCHHEDFGPNPTHLEMIPQPLLHSGPCDFP
jgi:hypothetical protein